jgi:hypothetical protein
MVQQIKKSSYLSGIVRVCRRDLDGNSVVGVAFLVAEGYLITCAHVVCAALNELNSWQEISPAKGVGRTVTLEFRQEELQVERTGKVVFWRFPVHAPQSDNDIAVLKLQGAAPEGFTPLPVTLRENYINQPFDVFGFPSGLDIGVWASGEVVGGTYDTAGRVEVKDTHQTGHAIAPGFSGSPVWAPTVDNAIIGMTVARDSERPEAKVGFMLPMRRLKRALEAVELESLMDILEPQASALENPIATAYRLAAGERMASPDFQMSIQADPVQALRENLTQLLSIPNQNQALPGTLPFAVAMLTLPELGLADPVRTALRGWLQNRVVDLAPLLAAAQQAVQDA